MALFTERAVKRHPAAVITLTTEMSALSKTLPTAEFEWFKSAESAAVWLGEWTEATSADSAEFTIIDGEDPALAFLTILIADTETMEVTKTVINPDNDTMRAWRDDIVSDISVLYETVNAPQKKAPVVKARRGLKLAGKPASRESEDEDTKPRVRRVIHKHGIEGPQ